MAGLGWQELVIVLVIIMIIFGAEQAAGNREITRSRRKGVPRGSAGAGGAGIGRNDGDRDGDDAALRCR